MDRLSPRREGIRPLKGGDPSLAALAPARRNVPRVPGGDDLGIGHDGWKAVVGEDNDHGG